ncbi:MAG TPA: hypothetical protein VK636_15390 [Gemmatimonadaceae bacterium]|nr:hypothetical protein [Gemmatimonadaceae bacterium]
MTPTASRRSSAGSGAPDQRRRAIAAVNVLRGDYERWAARCYRIRDKFGRIRPLLLNPVQREIGRIERQLLAHHDQARILTLKARQGGVSTDQQARALHQIWSQPNFDALTLAHTREDTAKLFAITTRAIEHFPRELLPRLGDAQTSEISFPGLDTKFFTGTAGARRTGRGLTIKRFHGSEFAFWDDPEGVLGSVTPALVPIGSVVQLETTASGFGSAAHQFWLEAIARGYTPLFFAWWQCDPLNYRLPLMADDELGFLEDEERDLIARHGLDLEQIKWRRLKMAELTRSTFLTEYAEDAETCWLAPGGMFFDAEMLKSLRLKAPTPIETHLGGTLEVFMTAAVIGNTRGTGPAPETIVIGADVAEGIGGDRSTFSARTRSTFRPVATFADARMPPKEFAAVLNEWGRKLGMAMLIVEKNAHGITVLRHLRDDHQYPLDRIYHRRPLDGPADNESERIGWATTAESKPLLLDAGREMFSAAKDGYAGVPPLEVVRDAFGVRRNDKGKIELTGKDMLVADMLAWIGRSSPDYVFF